MTIKLHGGVFGRNPTFNNVEVANKLDVKDSATFKDIFAEGVFDFDGILYVTNVAEDYGTTKAVQYFQTTGSFSRQFFKAGNHTIFGSAIGGTPAPIFVLDSAGDVSISSGNLVIGTSGKGIDFSATAGTGTSELFDDYEEGTWTPVPSSFINYTPTVQVGRYTKIGNLVTASFNMSWTSVNAGSNQFVVGGLPFTSSSATSYASAAAIGGSDYLTALVQVFAHVQDNTTSIKFFTMNSGLTKSNLLCSSWNASGSTNNIVGTVSYIV